MGVKKSVQKVRPKADISGLSTWVRIRCFFLWRHGDIKTFRPIWLILQKPFLTLQAWRLFWQRFFLLLCFYRAFSVISLKILVVPLHQVTCWEFLPGLAAKTLLDWTTVFCRNLSIKTSTIKDPTLNTLNIWINTMFINEIGLKIKSLYRNFRIAEDM